MSSHPFQPSADRLMAHNAEFAVRFDGAELAGPPTRHLAVVACMDARLDVYRILGLRDGEAHVIRNAGGILTDDVIRSLCLSQRTLGTREIVLVHHTDCGVEKLDADEFAERLEADAGQPPPFAIGGFDDPADDVRESMAALAASPFLLYTEHIRGFVYDVHDGLLHEIE